MYDILGLFKYNNEDNPTLFRFSAIVVEVDGNNVRFTPQELDDDIILCNVGRVRAEEIVRSIRPDCVLDITSDGILCFEDDVSEAEQDEDNDDNGNKDISGEPYRNLCELDEKPNIFQRMMGANKKAVKKRLILAALAALVIVLLISPVWYVQIQGDSEPYDLFVLVYNDPDDNIAPSVIDWSILPHYPEKVKVEGFSEEFNMVSTWNANSGRYPLFWEEIDHAIDSDVHANAFFMLISGKLTALSGDSNGNKLYGEDQIYINSQWLNEKYSLATVLWNIISVPGVEAEKISGVSLIQK